VFGPGKVTFHRILGGVLLYLTIGLTFVALFGLISLNVPDAFKGLEPLRGTCFATAGNLIYFSFVTLTTIGYGDIVPLHPYARGLANLEAVIATRHTRNCQREKPIGPQVQCSGVLAQAESDANPADPGKNQIYAEEQAENVETGHRPIDENDKTQQ
jgi:hypothetical protein